MMQVREDRGDDNSSTKYHYSDTGELLRLEDFDRDGQLTLTVDYRYDERGNNVERIIRNAQGKLVRRLEFDFDAEGNEVVHREFNDKNVLQFTQRV